ncbi:MAG: PadR family transcriptional regulator [bacterium]|nr:PadR family transcriptional regulator [Candidatus Minthenecus merdequi]
MSVQTSDNIKSQMRKGILEYCIMLSLDKHEAYTSDIIQAMRDGGFEVVEGTVYPLLARLKNNNFLGYRWEESTQGPPRKYFYLTEEGRSMLCELEHAFGEINELVRHIKNI